MRLTVLECYWTPEGNRAAWVQLKPLFGRTKRVLFVNTTGNGRTEKPLQDPSYQPELAYHWFDQHGQEISDHGLSPFNVALSHQLDRAFSHARAAGTVLELSETRKYETFMSEAKRLLTQDES